MAAIFSGLIAIPPSLIYHPFGGGLIGFGLLVGVWPMPSNPPTSPAPSPVMAAVARVMPHLVSPLSSLPRDWERVGTLWCSELVTVPRDAL